MTNIFLQLIKATQSGHQFWLRDISMISEHVHRLELRKSFKFWVDAAT